MPLPNFLIIGAPKCGTTTLFDVLDAHPQVSMCRWKEPLYFAYDPDATDSYIRRAPCKTFEEYQRAFDGAEQAVAVGEASPIYYNNRVALAKIRDTLPDVRLILTLRNPVEKLYSEAQMRLRDGKISDKQFAECHRISSLVEGSMYAEHYRECVRLFSKEQVKLVLFEELTTQPRVVLSEICEFLGLTVDYLDDSLPHSNVGGVPKSRARNLAGLAGKSLTRRSFFPKKLAAVLAKKTGPFLYRKSKLDPHVRSQLLQTFQSDIVELQQLSGKPVVDIWMPDSAQPADVVEKVQLRSEV